MDFLATPTRRRILFTALYFSEGAPVGFLWIAIPTLLRSRNVDVASITAVTSLLVAPWTLKFLWAPLLDVCRGARWGYRHWILLSQTLMTLTLAPLLAFDLRGDIEQQLTWLTPLLVLHAVFASTQDAAIDGLCIASTESVERGRLNGWMQAGFRVGMALLGGGVLLLVDDIGFRGAVACLVAVTGCSMLLIAMSHASRHDEPRLHIARRARLSLLAIGRVLRSPTTWLGILFALTAGAAFEASGAIEGPLLLDRGFSKQAIGAYQSGPKIVLIVIGSLLGGWSADYVPRRLLVALALSVNIASVAALAGGDLAFRGQHGAHLLVLASLVAFTTGVFLASSYALLMDLTARRVAATQFSAYMSAGNGCESWSTYAVGLLIAPYGYPFSLLTMCALSLGTVPLVLLLRPRSKVDG
ncbi:MAG: MFS transporter [Pirellulaceae bacterium]